MASSSYCQGLQSCLEMEPRVLRLKLAPAETNILPSNPKPPGAGDYDSGGWSFLQALAKNEPVSRDEVYVPPSSKRGASALSKKSLEMCTEGLGSETGSDSGDELNLLSAENRREYPAKSRETRRMNRSLSFPPPLSSISSGGAVQMRPRREGGRLVLEAVSASDSSAAYLKAERVDGRLRLHLMKDCISDEEDIEENDDEEEDDENEEKDEEEEVRENGEFGREKLKRLSRCGSSSLLNWEPLWVAT